MARMVWSQTPVPPGAGQEKEEPDHEPQEGAGSESLKHPQFHCSSGNQGYQRTQILQTGWDPGICGNQGFMGKVHF